MRHSAGPPLPRYSAALFRSVRQRGISMVARFIAAVVLALAAVVALAATKDDAQPTTTYFEEAKITVNARAHSDGYIRVRVIPENGTPLEATLAIHKHMSENDIAKGIAK